ncbi:hypothetical protein [Mycobacterium sp. 852002-51057_SCH5723018]|uniref:hypothetical protein n=1 Tax=Mycobacterium sp. 852002-51057_SCH5723018 TaxID=1834094 RepID=UPI0007FC2CA5|nr:hypothetical protein [Mycobacterium sp. 852002-51057_SCH5723018]OBG24702.1 hypothetical protein A5764_08335 [Mycobacterium sp. 852002-51057_SCH5723018]
MTVPRDHLDAVYELTGPATLDVDELAAQYEQALGRPVTAARPSDDEWARELGALGLPAHVEQHIATIAKLHRADRYNRSTDDVRDITGHPAQTVQQYVERHRDLFD